MKALIALLALGLVASSSFAADTEKKAPSPAQLAQQEKMKSCNAEAKTNALKGDAEKALAAGCDVYMSKPINIRELAARVEGFVDVREGQHWPPPYWPPPWR